MKKVQEDAQKEIDKQKEALDKLVEEEKQGLEEARKKA